MANNRTQKNDKTNENEESNNKDKSKKTCSLKKMIPFGWWGKDKNRDGGGETPCDEETKENEQERQPEVTEKAEQVHREQLRREQEARAMEKGRLDNQISTALSSDTGILALWNQIEMGIASGNVTLFKVYGASFLKKVDHMNTLVAKYQEIQPLPTDPQGDPMTRSLELPLESGAAVEKVNRTAKILKDSSILEKEDLDAQKLQEWYQQVFQIWRKQNVQ